MNIEDTLKARWIRNWGGLVGKTVEFVHQCYADEYIVIKFTDNSFCTIATEDQEHSSHVHLIGNWFSLVDLREMGLITEEERIACEDGLQKERDRDQEEKDRALYQTLKTRFEGEEG